MFSYLYQLIQNCIYLPSQTKQCPICLDEIHNHINFIITECGHSYHTSCLLKNIEYNGANCPCCRSNMINLVDNENDSDSSSSSSSSNEEVLVTETHINLVGDYGLRGFRFFMNNIDELDHDDDDINIEIHGHEINGLTVNYIINALAKYNHEINKEDIISLLIFSLYGNLYNNIDEYILNKMEHTTNIFDQILFESINE